MFNKARRKLTTLYLMIIMAISIAFSFVVYKVSTRELDRFSELQRVRIERRIQDEYFGVMRHQGSPMPIIDPLLIADVKNRTIGFLAVLNGIIFMFSAICGYFLAEKTLKPIKDMVNEQNRFISDASHELKTPITSLRLALEVYLRDKLSTKTSADTVIKDSLEEVKRLQKLTDSLLTITGYQKSSKTQIRSVVQLKNVIVKVIERLNPQVIAKELSVKIKGDEMNVFFNPDQLDELLSIILDNAIKYSKKGKNIYINLKKEKSVILTIKDQGIGIPKKDLPHIFDRFYRADQSRGGERAGYGLGLSIAKQITKANKASINIQSAQGKGTLVKIVLPTK